MRQLLAVAVVLALAAPLAIGQSDAKATPGCAPLSSESAGVYRAFLASYMKTEERSTLNLAGTTERLELSELDRDTCAAGIDPASLKEAATDEHAFTPGEKLLDNVNLVDASQQAEIIRKNDPETAMRNGKSVEAAVDEAFANGLFTFSEIAFDSAHNLAVFSYRFYCGRLCGHGGVVVMEKAGEGWRRAKRSCSDWQS